MGVVRLCQLGLAVVIMLVAISGAGAQPPAQNRAKVEVVPHISHSGGVTSVAFSPDGARVLSGSRDTTIRLWDAATGALLRTFQAHSHGVNSVAFSPDGANVLSGSDDKTVRLWDAATGALLHTFRGHSGWVRSVTFSPDGARVLSGSSDNTVRLWDAATGALLRSFQWHSDSVWSVVFSPNGVSVLSGDNDNTVRLWDPANDRLLRTFEGHSGRVRSVAFSPDGARVLSGSDDKTISLWDANTGALLRSFKGHSGLVSSVAFSPDGARVLSGSLDSTLRLWDATTGALLRSFERHSGRVRSVAFSPDGARVLSGSLDSTVRLWDATTGALPRSFELGHSKLVLSVAFSGDDARVLSGSEDKTIKLWDAATGALLRTFLGHSDVVSSVAFSGDDARVLSGSFDRTVRLWDLATGALLRTFEGHSGAVSSVAFSRDDKRVLSGSSDHTVRLWDAAMGTLLRTFEGHSNSVLSVAFSRDGKRVLSGSVDKTVRLWDAATGALLHTFRGHSGWVESVTFSPDGARVLSGSFDGTVRLWDSTTSTLLRTLKGHTGEVSSVAFSPDNRRIVSGGSDTTVRIWDAATGAQLASFLGGRDGEWLAITPGGFFDYQGDIDKFVHLVAPRRDGKGLEVLSINQTFKELYRPDLVQAALKGDLKGAYKDAAFHLDLEKILDTGPAPRIEHLEKKTERAGDTIKLVVSIVDSGGGIGPRVLWKVNGQTQGRVEPEELKGAQALSFSRFTLNETLRIDPSKENIVELTAYNGKGLLATPPFRITVDKWGATTEDRSRMHVLVIGVDEYRMASYKLKYAVNDALKFSKALEIVGSTLFAKVEPTILRDEQVTEKAIAAAFDRIGADARTGDVFVLYLAGHGKAIAGKYYYYPQTLEEDQSVEQHAIGQDKWEEWLARVGHVRKSVLFIDTCYGGTAAALVRGDDGVIETAVNHLRHATGQNLIAASRQAAYEGYKGHGVLTYALLEALHKTDAGGSDDTVRISGLGNYVNGRVPKITQELFKEQQWPILRLLGDFPLGIRQSVLEQLTSTISKTATHVLIRPELPRKQPAADAAASGKLLKPGTRVRPVEFVGSWAAVARDGEMLGFVPADALAPMQ